MGEGGGGDGRKVVVRGQGGRWAREGETHLGVVVCGQRGARVVQQQKKKQQQPRGKEGRPEVEEPASQPAADGPGGSGSIQTDRKKKTTLTLGMTMDMILSSCSLCCHASSTLTHRLTD